MIDRDRKKSYNTLELQIARLFLSYPRVEPGTIISYKTTHLRKTAKFKAKQ